VRTTATSDADGLVVLLVPRLGVVVPSPSSKSSATSGVGRAVDLSGARCGWVGGWVLWVGGLVSTECSGDVVGGCVIVVA
jgi:hypothetical protein